MTNKPTTNSILPFLFGATLLAVWLLYLILPQQSFSQKENRPLQTRPALSFATLKDGSFMEQFETYTTEQLPFREFFVDGKAALNSLTLSRENNGIVRGKDDYLFERSPLSLNQLKKNETAIRQFAEKAGRPVTVAIAPNAVQILQEDLPAGFPRIDQETQLRDFYAKAQELENVNTVDLIEALMPHKDEQLYYRTDHHWTTQAAYYAYRDIVSKLAAANGSGQADAGSGPVELQTLTKHEINDFYGTLSAKYKAETAPDTLTWYDVPITTFERSDGDFDTLYDTDKLKIYDKYAMFLRGNDEICTIKAKNAGNAKHLIVFKDSYANCLIPFLTYNYDEITVVDLRYYADKVSELLSADPEADILLLYNFSFLSEDNHFYRLTL